MDKRRRTREDRLSILPDHLIDRILSLVGTKQAVETSVLSHGWRYTWTKMTCLSFLSEEFKKRANFSKFVEHVLSNRDERLDLFSLKLTFSAAVVSQEILETILMYAVSHKLQQLNITCLHGKTLEFHPSLLSCQSLTHLTLHGYVYHGTENFSSCANLEILTLRKCKLIHGFEINNLRLSSLKLKEGRKRVNVSAPQLKNLTVRNCPDISLDHTPRLSSLRYIDSGYEDDEEEEEAEEEDDDEPDDYYQGFSPLLIHGQLCHLEKVHICIDRPIKKGEGILKLISMLKKLSSVRFLTLNLELVKILSSSVSGLPCLFYNLEALKVYPQDEKSELKLSNEAKKYLLDGSPCATLSIDPHKDTIVNNLLQELILVFEDWIKEKKDRRYEFECWDDFTECMDKWTNFRDRVLVLLLKIRNTLKRVPTSSHQAKLQKKRTLSRLFAKAASIMDNMVGRLPIPPSYYSLPDFN